MLRYSSRIGADHSTVVNPVSSRLIESSVRTNGCSVSPRKLKDPSGLPMSTAAACSPVSGSTAETVPSQLSTIMTGAIRWYWSTR
jgi:hypothetical protein